MVCAIWYQVPFVQFKKLEKHLFRSVAFSKVVGLCFSLFLIKTRKTSHIKLKTSHRKPSLS